MNPSQPLALNVRALGHVLTLGAVLVCPLLSLAQSDDFNDGNDVGWTRYDPLAGFNLTATYSFPSGGYRLQTTYLTMMANNPGRCGSVRQESLSDFYVAVDVVNWNPNLRQSLGVLGRVNTPGLQSTTGYAFTWDRGNPTSSTSGDVDISKITGEVPAEVPLSTITNAYGVGDAFRLTNGNSYRFVFIGRGTQLEGRIYQLPDLTLPRLVVQGTDGTYASGRCGLVVFDNTGGQGQTDATFDNWFMSDVEPPRIVISDANPQTGDLVLTWPGYASNFVFECSSVLPNVTWSPVVGTIFGPFSFPLDPTNPNYICFTSIGAGNKFFRLRRP